MNHLLGAEVEADEVAHGEDFVAAAALTAEPHLATPQITSRCIVFPPESGPGRRDIRKPLGRVGGCSRRSSAVRSVIVGRFA